MKKLLLKLTLFIIPVFIYFGVGIYIDAYNVFHVDDIRLTRVVPNENFIKTKYIIEHKDKFNAFVFGSSRAGNLPKAGLPEFAEDGTTLNWYNMTYSMGGIEENYMTAKSFVDAGVQIKEILILIDEISMWKGASDSLDNLIFTTYQTYEKHPVAFYYSYLKQKPLLDLIPEISADKHSERIGDQEYIQRKEQYYSYGGFDGSIDFPDSEDGEMPAPEPSLLYDEQCQSIHYLQELKNLCDDNNIKLVVVTSPVLESTYREGVANGYLRFLNDVEQVTDYYCFSGLNEYTQHPKYYYDASHFMPCVGYEMEKVVFDSGNTPVDEACMFGILVTQDNVDSVMERLQKEVDQ